MTRPRTLMNARHRGGTGRSPRPAEGTMTRPNSSRWSRTASCGQTAGRARTLPATGERPAAAGSPAPRFIRLALAAAALATGPAAAPLHAQAPAEGAPMFTPVTWERLVNAVDEPHNWLMYNGTLDSQRFSRLDRIDRSNVADLELKWAHHIPQLDRAETTPLVVDGVMFITESPSNVVAVDAATGRPFWRYDHPLPDDLRICCGRNNRGVAILDELLFMSTLDAHLVAIDARTGSLVWNREVADHRGGYSKTAAPLVVKDRVVTGIAGGEFGIRGFLDAYDARTGELEWRTYTIPGPDHPDNLTWAGDSWRTGGSPTWITGSYDPELNLVYWGTGNPGPDWNGEVRPGDNLYSDSVLALDGDTGEMSWYFQFTPHDIHDWDAIQIPVLADIELDGEPRQAMLWANRNGFYYTLDRATGEFLLGEAFAHQTWAEGLDSNGRPIRRPNTSAQPHRHPRRPHRGRRHQLVVARLQPAHRPALRQRVRRRGAVLHPRRGVRRGRHLSGRGHRDPAAHRPLPQRHPRHRPDHRRGPLGVPDDAAEPRGGAGHGRRPRVQRQRRRLLLRPRRGERRPPVADLPGRPGQRLADELRGRRPAVRDDDHRQHAVHLRARRLAVCAARVPKHKGEPSGYADCNEHPELHTRSYVIETEDDLRRCMRRDVTEFP